MRLPAVAMAVATSTGDSPPYVDRAVTCEPVTIELLGEYEGACTPTCAGRGGKQEHNELGGHVAVVVDGQAAAQGWGMVDRGGPFRCRKVAEDSRTRHGGSARRRCELGGSVASGDIGRRRQRGVSRVCS
jgi:hypothetical protein